VNGEELYTGCEDDGYSVVVNGNTYNQNNPLGTEILTSFLGCDSTVAINLTYNASVSGEELYTGCEDDGYSVLVNSNLYNQATPNGSETLISSNGCDSIVTINLVFNPTLTGDELYTGCEEDGYSVIVNSNIYDQSNPSGTEILTSSLGCDSIVTINLIYNQSSSGNENYVGCVGDGYTVDVNGVIYNETNPTGVQILTNSNGCDSTIIIDLVFNNETFGEELHNGCIGDGYSIVVNGNTYDELNPVGTELLTNYLNCDSTVSIDLSFSNSVTGEELYNGCIGDGYSVLVNGNTYDESNSNGTEILTSTGGCDSIVTITLTFNSELTGEELYNGCEDDGYSVVVNDNTYNQGNPTGSETLISSSGCDSIVTIDLIFNQIANSEELHNGCQGDGYVILVNGIVYNESNPTGTETLTTSAGCDSIVTINLVFNDVLSGEELHDGCIDDGYSVVVNNITYDQGNPIGSETLTSSAGCDSIVSINLVFNDVLTADELYIGCDDDGYSVVVNNNTYDQDNPIGSETLTSSIGCDSIVSINLTFNPELFGDELYTGCEDDGYSVLVNGNIYTKTIH